MTRFTSLPALSAESTALSAGLDELQETEWDRTTRCEPWTVRQLVGHVLVVLSRVEPMVEGTPPSGTPISPAAYYRPDDRFSSQANRQRVQAGIDRSTGVASGRALAGALHDARETIEQIARSEEPDRLVTTRHGDVMRLDDFLVTRVVELMLHGIDVADAVGTTAWTTPPAADLVLQLLAGDDADRVRSLPWDVPTLLRCATGRALDDGPSAQILDDLGVRWLSLG